MITYKRPTTIGQNVTSYKHLALNTTKKHPKVDRGLARTVHFVVAMEDVTNPSSQLFHISIMQKAKAFPLKQNLTRADYGIDVVTCVICSEHFTLTKQQTNFPRDAHCNEVLRT